MDKLELLRRSILATARSMDMHKESSCPEFANFAEGWCAALGAVLITLDELTSDYEK
ncbi:MAG: hypothetical protein QM401_07335 [Bacillota bacterium]|nr:hypothetical protein [Bacillota bacterium]